MSKTVNGREFSRQGKPVDRAEVARALRKIQAAAADAEQRLWAREPGFGADYSYFDMADIGALANTMCAALNACGAEPGDSRGIATKEAQLVALADLWRTA